jgi:hypothetical protein
VLGIGFRVLGNKPSRGGTLQSPLPANALGKPDYSTKTFRDFAGKIRGNFFWPQIQRHAFARDGRDQRFTLDSCAARLIFLSSHNSW